MKSSLYGRLLLSNAVVAWARMQRWTAQTVREILLARTWCHAL